MCSWCRVRTIDAGQADGAAVFLRDQTTAYNLCQGRAPQCTGITMYDKALCAKFRQAVTPDGILTAALQGKGMTQRHAACSKDF